MLFFFVYVVRLCVLVVEYYCVVDDVKVGWCMKVLMGEVVSVVDFGFELFFIEGEVVCVDEVIVDLELDEGILWVIIGV